MGKPEREIIIDLSDEVTNRELLAVAHRLGTRRVLTGERLTSLTDGGSIAEGASGLRVLTSVETARAASKAGERFGISLTIRGAADLKDAIEASKLGAELMVIRAANWKIIPLENLIAELRGKGTDIFAYAIGAEEVETLFGVLERGVDGVILKPRDVKEVENAFRAIKRGSWLDLSYAIITDVTDVGMGDRACVDTVAMLGMGQGLLVGSRSSFLFLVHNESVGSEFTSPRPFRVNAGAIHSYVLAPDNKTRYLSELKGGDRILVVEADGGFQVVAVGRSKIEKRPLRMVEAECEGERGSIILQNAETIRLVGKGGRLIPVTEIKASDEVLVHCKAAKGRHFGTEVEEFILEK